MTMGGLGTEKVADNASVQSSSSSEKMDGEGRLAIKDIEKLTGGHLDVKLSPMDPSQMRQFVHTPKNGVKVPLELNTMIDSLENDGFLVISPENRPAQVVARLVDQKK